jgi:cytochrome c-type biogenesis protein
MGSFLIGVTFGAAWTPCAGPILGSILVIAGTRASVSQGARLLSIYSLGIAVPFFITGLLINYFIDHINRFNRVISIINIVGGVFLVIVGILVATDYLAVISGRLLAGFVK